MLYGVADDVAAIVAKGPAFASAIATIVNRAGPYVGTVQKVVSDPAFPTVMQRIETIAALEDASSTGGGPSTPGGVGVGLSKAVPILDGYIFYKKNPWLGIAAIGLVVAVIGGIGYRIGQRKR